MGVGRGGGRGVSRGVSMGVGRRACFRIVVALALAPKRPDKTKHVGVLDYRAACVAPAAEVKQVRRHLRHELTIGFDT